MRAGSARVGRAKGGAALGLMMPLVALIPYFPTPVWEFGPLVLDSWALLVSIGFIFGLELTRWRGIKTGLDVRNVVDGAVVVVAMGFLVGHIVHVVAYNPHLLEEQGIMAILKVWAGFSSTGGFIGAVLGAVLFFHYLPRWFGKDAAVFRSKQVVGTWANIVGWLGREKAFWAHSDALMFGFPFGWTFGRLGCFSAHDHVGQPSTFFLAVDFPQAYFGGPRHDLGLYEALWTAVIAATFWALREYKGRPGFFVALFCAMYAPARIGLDFLRNTDLQNADVRWIGLTPAQWGMTTMALAGAGLAVWLRRAPDSATKV